MENPTISLDLLKPGQIIEITYKRLPDVEEDLGFNINKYSFKILAVNGLIIAISQVNQFDMFKSWITLEQLLQDIEFYKNRRTRSPYQEFDKVKLLGPDVSINDFYIG